MHIHHNPIGRHSHEHTKANKDELLALMVEHKITPQGIYHCLV